MHEALITVATFDSQPEAALAYSVLESHGIDCILLDEHVVSISAPLAAAVGGIKLQVRESDAGLAREVLAQPDDPEPQGSPEARAVVEQQPPQCPECLSRDVEPSGHGSTLVVLLSWLGGMHSRAHRCWVCRACGADWQP